MTTLTATTLRPVVITSATAFGRRQAEALAALVEARHGGRPATWRWVDPARELEAGLAEALTDALDVRHHPQAGPGQPLVLVLADAVEPTAATRVAGLVRSARREFQRSSLDGQVVLTIHAGALGGRVAPDEQLDALDAVARTADATLVVTDTDTSGRRFREPDAIAAVALFLACLLENDAVQALVAEEAWASAEGGGQVGLGVARVDLDEQPLRPLLCQRLHRAAYATLFPPPVAVSDKSPWQGPISTRILGALQQRAGGSLEPVREALVRWASGLDESWLRACLDETATSVREALVDLIPPPPPVTVPRPGFWRRLLAWLHRALVVLIRVLTFGLLCRPARSIPPPLVTGPPPPPTTSAAWAGRLVGVERLRAQLERVEAALRPVAVPGPAAAGPVDVRLADAPEIQDRAYDRCAPADGVLAGAMMRGFSPTRLLEPGTDPEAVRARLDDLVEQLLKLPERSRLLRLDDVRPFLARVAGSVQPLFCGPGGRTRRLALMPPGLVGANLPGDLLVSPGRESEAVFLAIEGGVSLRSLFSEEAYSHVTA